MKEQTPQIPSPSNRWRHWEQPGPKTNIQRPICSKHVTSNKTDKGSVPCCQCKNWVHTSCTTLPNTKHRTNTWACPKCTNPTSYYQLSNNNKYYQLTCTSTITTTQNHTQNLNYTVRVPPLPHNSTTSPKPDSQQHTHGTSNTNNKNILRLNIDGINTKIHELADLINKRKNSKDTEKFQMVGT